MPTTCRRAAVLSILACACTASPSPTPTAAPVPRRSGTSITAATAQGESLPDDYVTRIGPALRSLVDSAASDSSWMRHVYLTARRDGTIRFDRSAAPDDNIGRALEQQVAKAGAARVFTPLPLGWDDSLSLDLRIVHPPAGLPMPDTSGAYFEFQVDRPAHAASVPTPAYPAALSTARTAGRVIARFIVGVDGRVEPASFVVVQSTAPEFSDAVRTALRGAVYTPAELKGRTVRQVVMQPFSFSAP